MRRRALALGLLLAAAAPVVAGEDATERAGAEIEALIETVRGSDCRFHRNGEWKSADAAADHLARKLRFARLFGREGSAEDFIAEAGTRSSVSGEAYRVQCGDAPARPSAEWLRQHLEALRSGEAS